MWWAFQGHFNKVNILLHFTAILQLQCFQVPTTKMVWSAMPTILEIGNYWDSHFLPHEKLFIYCIDKTSDSMFQRVVTLSSFDQDWWWNSIVQFMDVHIILQLIVADTWKTRADAVLLLWLLKHLSQKTVLELHPLRWFHQGKSVQVTCSGNAVHCMMANSIPFVAIKLNPMF